MNSSNIGKVIAVLVDMEHAGIVRKFAIGGAFAAVLHNEPISTIDLDIFFLLTKQSESPILSLSEIYEYAKTHRFEFDHEFINIYGWLVQFVEASHNALWKEAIEAATTIRIETFDVPVITPEYLIVMWLSSGRAKDFQKITLFLDAGLLDTEELTNILKRHDLLIKWNKEKWRFTDEN